MVLNSLSTGPCVDGASIRLFLGTEYDEKPERSWTIDDADFQLIRELLANERGVSCCLFSDGIFEPRVAFIRTV